ncbi:MAG: hypothetical protein HZA35_03315 [Parcubacteria group bacterium]|nr:hypothetical protein [Parcubacteria group bacterium]
MSFFLFYKSYALGPVRVSDTIGDSRPGIGADHVLQFTPSSTIPVNGKIIIIPQPNAFTIPSGMDRSDVDVLVNGVEKLLSATPGVGTDIVVTMVSGTSGVITMTPKSGPINAGSVVTVLIGVNATYIDLGAYQIQSPSSTGSYAVDIEIKDASNVRLGVASAMVAILEGVGMTGYIGAAPPPPPVPAPAPAPAGGGAGGLQIVQTFGTGTIVFCGKGYPREKVALLKDAQVATSTIAQTDDGFSFTLGSLNGLYSFGFYGTDHKGRVSSVATLAVRAENDKSLQAPCIILPPTLTTDKSEIKIGDTLIISGQTVSFGEVSIVVAPGKLDDAARRVITTTADKDGFYRTSFLTTGLVQGATYLVAAQVKKESYLSSYSLSDEVIVGGKTVFRGEGEKICFRYDLNCDGSVNLVDFSILAYWYKRPLTDIARQKYDLNDDGKVDLRDFSILAFYWTG